MKESAKMMDYNLLQTLSHMSYSCASTIQLGPPIMQFLIHYSLDFGNCKWAEKTTLRPITVWSSIASTIQLHSWGQLICNFEIHYPLDQQLQMGWKDNFEETVWSCSLHSYWTNPDAWNEDLYGQKNAHFNIKPQQIHLFFLTIINNSDSHIASRYSLKPRPLNI